MLWLRVCRYQVSFSSDSVPGGAEVGGQVSAACVGEGAELVRVAVSAPVGAVLEQQAVLFLQRPRRPQQGASGRPEVDAAQVRRRRRGHLVAPVEQGLEGIAFPLPVVLRENPGEGGVAVPGVGDLVEGRRGGNPVTDVGREAAEEPAVVVCGQPETGKQQIDRGAEHPFEALVVPQLEAAAGADPGEGDHRGQGVEVVARGALPPEAVVPYPFGELVVEAVLLLEGDAEEALLSDQEPDGGDGGVVPVLDVVDPVVLLAEDVLGRRQEEPFLDLAPLVFRQAVPEQVVSHGEGDQPDRLVEGLEGSLAVSELPGLQGTVAAVAGCVPGQDFACPPQMGRLPVDAPAQGKGEGHRRQAVVDEPQPGRIERLPGEESAVARAAVPGG